MTRGEEGEAFFEEEERRDRVTSHCLPWIISPRLPTERTFGSRVCQYAIILTLPFPHLSSSSANECQALTPKTSRTYHFFRSLGPPWRIGEVARQRLDDGFNELWFSVSELLFLVQGKGPLVRGMIAKWVSHLLLAHGGGAEREVFLLRVELPDRRPPPDNLGKGAGGRFCRLARVAGGG